MATYDRDDIPPLPSDAALPTIWTSAVGQTRPCGHLVPSFRLPSWKPPRSRLWSALPGKGDQLRLRADNSSVP